MECHYELKEGCLTISMPKELDHHSAGTVRTEIDETMDAFQCRHLIFDFEKVTFMDSSGIAVVLRTWKRMCQLGGSMRLQNVPSYAAKVLKAAGVDKLLEMTEKE